MKAKCSICGHQMRSRKSSKRSARANLLIAIRKHAWKSHRNTMIARIKRGKKASQINPSVQDFVEALSEGPRAALQVYSKWTERQYQATKRVMDALEPLLPIEVRTAWAAVEAYHDWRK